MQGFLAGTRMSATIVHHPLFKCTPMNLRARQLYARMQEDIEAAETGCSNEMRSVETCFSIALSYWNRIRDIAETHVFPSQADEVCFFKHIKPLFLSAMEYYMLLYQALLFKPTSDEDELLSYWLKQLNRVDQFVERHREFYQYCQSDRTEHDLLYFTRSVNPASFHAKPVGGLRPRHGRSAYLAARIRAFDQYRQYLEMQVKSMADGNRKKLFVRKLKTA